MRLVQVTVPRGKREAVLDVLDERDIDYVVVDETSGREYTAVVNFPLPTEAVEEVLSELRSSGLSEEAYTVVVDAETVVSRNFEELKQQYAAEVEHNQIACEELVATVEEFTSSRRTFVVMLVVSAVLATAGALLDSAIVMVGANVIVPLMNPAMAASVGSVLSDRDLFARGVRWQLAGLALVVVAASAFALFVRVTGLLPPDTDVLTLEQVRQGSSSSLLSLVVALGAGVAGSVSLMTGVSSALVGVAIAVALVPPAATVGIGIAWTAPGLALESGVLLVVNLVSINLAALVVLWRAGYRPVEFKETDEARSETLKRGAVLVVLILVLAAFIGVTTNAARSRAGFEQSVRDDIESLLDEPRYGDTVLLDVTVEYGPGTLFAQPTRVVVRVGRTDAEPVPGLADAIAARLNASGSMRVEVESVQVATAD
ncbi:TIGR00341 family protein [Halobacterium zhouii]|uniref:TIGR00341 family protein n=1 Tax=Halobacterium zhouii TaxID=2902624 RepID=UPI001E3ED5B2|nr:TIGR00341 family protein [Halobacterium zhouii]